MGEKRMSSTRALTGHTAFVTGGGRGIGRAIALALAREGASVGVAARTTSQVSEVAGEIRSLGGVGVGLAIDVTQADVTAMVSGVASQLGPVDILVNCAGGAQSAPFVRTDPDLWEKMISVNLHSVYHCTRVFLPGMIDKGW